ncbi:unnamed protein product [Didymodactylos carnosus]|uniref:Uncharacterized protein n=1 Tax=Didymodactylos carnosus TaxID=1234261 RepID=A0A8S2FRF9_9BILA|nr:unnamed protein product [Didymodactylos carnosus]CAF4314146.1 unnamed protein product [Didymodactylos carnosus]
MFNLVKSKNGRLQFLEANGFYLLYELTMNVLTNDNYCTFLDLACQVMLRCCPKQNLPIESTFSPIKYQLPPGFEYIVFNEMLIADPKVMKDLDDMRGKCKSALSSNEQQQQQQKFRPKSSMTLSTPATPPVKSLRPKSSKGRLKQDEVIKIPEDDLNDMDEDDEFCESDDDEQSDDENKNNDEDSGDDEEREQKEDLSELKETLSSSTLNNNDTNRRDPDELAMCYEQFFDEMVDPISKLRTKMAQPIIDSRTNILLLNLIQTNQMEELPREVHQDYVLRSSNHQQIPIIEDELTQKYFLTYSLLAKMTKSAYRFTKIAHPDCYGAQSNPKCEIMQKLDVKGTKTSLLGDIRRILYSPTIINRTVYDLDALLVNSSNTQMSQTNILQNDDKRQCQMPRTSDHLHFDSQFECGNLRKAIQVKFHSLNK